MADLKAIGALLAKADRRIFKAQCSLIEARGALVLLEEAYHRRSKPNLRKAVDKYLGE